MQNQELKEEIALIEKLVKDAEAFSKNKNFTPSHRSACAEEGKVFKRVLDKLRSFENRGG